MDDFIYIGIDQSMNSTGVVAIDEEYKIIDDYIISSDKSLENYERIMNIGDNLIVNILKLKDEYDCILKCCIEGLSFASHGRGVIQQGALHNYIRILLLKNDIQNVVCEPTVLKKFVTGKGQCKKDLMLMKIFKKWNIEFDNTDIADAYALARYCKDYYNNDITNN